jgi:hypothetical protein
MAATTGTAEEEERLLTGIPMGLDRRAPKYENLIL